MKKLLIIAAIAFAGTSQANTLSADQAFAQIVELVEAGISMERLRQNNPAQCGDAMRYNQKKAAILREAVDKLPRFEYTNLKIAAANLNRCVSCLPSALETCGEILEELENN